MAFRIKGSHITALLIAGAVIGWMATGDIVVGGQANSANAVAPPAERRDDDAKVFKVRFVAVSPEIRPDILPCVPRHREHWKSGSYQKAIGSRWVTWFANWTVVSDKRSWPVPLQCWNRLHLSMPVR